MRSPEDALRMFGPAIGDELSRSSLDACGRCYHLPPHVYACRTHSGIVFLDAKRDRYFGLGGARVTRLADRVVGVRGKDPLPDDHPVQSVELEEVERIARKLIDAGLLCPESDDGSPRDDLSIPHPAMELEWTVSEERRSVRAVDVANFLCAYVKASWWLRRWCLGSIASRVSAARRDGDEFDSERALQLVQRFQMLRAWTFTGKDRCLLSALSLIFFLQRYGCFPYFVIGVKTAPFAAHSWVQRDGLVLDGDPASVGHFVPILVA